MTRHQLVGALALIAGGALLATNVATATTKSDQPVAAISAPSASERGAPLVLTTELYASGLSDPIYLTHAPDDFSREFVIEQNTRRIRIIKDGVVTGTFLTVTSASPSGSERGLLGLAFHPDYENNGYFYVNYTAGSSPGSTVVERYQVSAGDPDVANASSGTPVISFSQDFGNHNGGWIDFGPDGYLYIATGDGGSGNDPLARAQATNTLLGKMLRIDVDGDDFPGDPNANYAIPAGNPFAMSGGLKEIWHRGLRNPWRNDFDEETGDLYIGDVGQSAREEISFQPAGVGNLNFGWRCMEGNRCTSLTGCTCFSTALTDPIIDYVWTQAPCSSVTGGHVYRGCAIPELQGTYFYGDYCRGQIWSLEYDGSTVSNSQERTAELAAGSWAQTFGLASFGEDAYGEIYIVMIGGTIHKIVAASGATCDDCNSTESCDLCDIKDGTSSDSGGNGIPDECECPWDLDGDGAVGSGDLAELISFWTQVGVPADFDGGGVGSSDLAILLGRWGPCP